jgi:hypothetical protein
MRNIYRVTYRSHSGRIKAEELPADTHFDAAITVRQTHQLKFSDIISNEIMGTGMGRKPGRKAPENDR